MMNLKPCPCGKTPSEIIYTWLPEYKTALAHGDCCGNWLLNVTHFEISDIDGLRPTQQQVEASWNAAPSGEK